LYGHLCRTRAFCVQRSSGPQCYLSSFQTFQLFQQKRIRLCISFNPFLWSVLRWRRTIYQVRTLHIVPLLRQPFFSFIDVASLWRAESSGSQQVYRKLFPHGPHSSKNNFSEIKISQRRDWETPYLSYYGSWYGICCVYVSHYSNSDFKLTSDAKIQPAITRCRKGRQLLLLTFITLVTL